MLSQTEKILDDILARVSADNEQLSEYPKRLLEVMGEKYSVFKDL